MQNRLTMVLDFLAAKRLAGGNRNIKEHDL
jgi:hypothetical protein